MAKLAVVTGTTSGIGEQFARLLAARGWALVILNRDVTRAQRLADELGEAVVGSVPADLADHTSIQDAADQIASRFPRIDLLVNNAGVLLGPRRDSGHGAEMHFEVNTLAPYQLVRRLAEALAAARGMVLTVGSRGMFHAGGLRVEDLANPSDNRPLFGPYTQSKFAVAALMSAMSAEYADRGMVFRTCCPGPTKTPATAGEGMPWFLRPVRAVAFKPAAKAATTLLDAMDPRFGRETGLYIQDGKVGQLPAQATDPEVQSRLLALSLALTGV